MGPLEARGVRFDDALEDSCLLDRKIELARAEERKNPQRSGYAGRLGPAIPAAFAAKTSTLRPQEQSLR